MVSIASFSIDSIQFLDPAGNLSERAPPFARQREQITALYRQMVLTRTFDTKAVALQRTGQLGTYSSSLGMEAISVGVGSAMEDGDILAPAYRDHGTQFCRGVSMTEVLLYWGGDERGSHFESCPQDLPTTVPVASQMGLAVGVAAALQYRGQPHGVVALCGDGATSKGDFYEAINVAGAWHLPVVFVVNNNQWAISHPREAQTACETLAQKAIAGGFTGIQIDGNDVVAVRKVMDEALSQARSGGGPTLIEALTYRLCDHTTADDASRYRPPEEVSQHWLEEPLVRVKAYLVNHHSWSKEEEEALIEETTRAVDEAARHYLETPRQPVESIFDFLHESLPQSLLSQREAAIARKRRHE